MHDMLRKIIESKKNRLASLLQHDASPSLSAFQAKQSLTKQKFAPTSSSVGGSKFLIQLQKNTSLLCNKITLIGELKFASPSAGVLGSPETLLFRAQAYEHAGIDAISIITEEEFFQGKPEFVSEVKKHVKLPILQKDFVIDASQIDAAAMLGSDALLLIARIVTTHKLQQFVKRCLELGIEPVVEVANEADLAKALQTETRIIAVNARDLDTFTVDVRQACELIKKIPAKYVRLGFSGVASSTEIVQYTEAGAQGVLVGTSLMKAGNIEEYIKELRGGM